MPTRNRRHLLPEAIGAILAQTYQHWELLLCPWGDDISDLVPDDPRIHVIPRITENLSETLNDMVWHSTGEVLNVTADDDIMEPVALSAVAAYSRLRIHPWIVGRLLGAGTPRCTYEQLLNANALPCPAVFWTRAAGDLAGSFDPAHQLCFDYDYWIRLWQTSGPPMFINYALSSYRDHPAQVTHTYPEAVRADAEAIRRKHENLFFESRS